jgi:hypothetical protein
MQPSLAQRLAVTSHPQDEKSKAQRRHEDHEDERKKENWSTHLLSRRDLFFMIFVVRVLIFRNQISM